MEYKIEKVFNNIFVIVASDDYERSMLFCRVQEFYESPCKKFRDNKFSIWDYYRWYSKKNGCFSYTRDWTGFNLPLIVAKKCYEINEVETPYDKIMKKIVDELFESGKRQYIIGTDSLNNLTYRHELAHGLYYTNLEYKLEMDKITSSINNLDMIKFKKNLKTIGYCSSVYKDEIQAYMSTEINKKITKGVSSRKKYHQKYKKMFKKYT